MKRRVLVASLLLLTGLGPAPSLAASVYVKSLKAKLFAEPRFDAQLVVEAEKGQELLLMEKGERWFKVGLTTRQGWVSALLVSAEPPKGKASILGEDAEDISGKSRRRASAIATAGASRGLTEEGAKELDAKDSKANWQALAKVEAAKVDRGEALTYLLAGINKGGEAKR